MPVLVALLGGPVWAEEPGDAAAGAKVFAKCRACHQIGEGAHNAVGPELNGVIGRHSGSVPDYNYSDANRNSGLTWDEPTFRRYIRDPRGVVPGTKMTFSGLTRDRDVDDVLAYLRGFGPEGKPRP
ncbi:cytochrome c family protein [Lichenihabitans sp. Uapishka_5]|nr:cytochrome c family protein [Lichenihabitans sp. Uapishka_5]MDX7953325.1 cytochrome c family protein [Lichenihabitans sp. Uapishka_5]